MKSQIKKIGKVSFPKFTGERAYQIAIQKGEPLPEQFARWQPTVDALLTGVEVDGDVYMTIDQGRVEEGCTQRREGPHIDGNWEITGHRVMAWDHSGGGHWHTKNLETGGIILASCCNGAKAYLGEFDEVVGEGGDCSHIDLSESNQEVLEANTGYLGNVTMIHEAMPVNKAVDRSFIRLTLPAGYKYAA